VVLSSCYGSGILVEVVVVGLDFFAFVLVFDELFVFFPLQFFDFFTVAFIDVLLDGSDLIL